jgi:hypothetical protein
VQTWDGGIVSVLILEVYHPAVSLSTLDWPEDTPTRHRPPRGRTHPWTRYQCPLQPAAALHPRSVHNLVHSERDFLRVSSPVRLSAGSGGVDGNVSGVSRTPTPHPDIAGMQEAIDDVHENAAEDFSHYGRRGRLVCTRSEWGRREQERQSVIGDEWGRLRYGWGLQLSMCLLFST